MKNFLDNAGKPAKMTKNGIKTQVEPKLSPAQPSEAVIMIPIGTRGNLFSGGSKWSSKMAANWILDRPNMVHRPQLHPFNNFAKFHDTLQTSFGDMATFWRGIGQLQNAIRI